MRTIFPKLERSRPRNAGGEKKNPHHYKFLKRDLENIVRNNTGGVLPVQGSMGGKGMQCETFFIPATLLHYKEACRVDLGYHCQGQVQLEVLCFPHTFSPA